MTNKHHRDITIHSISTVSSTSHHMIHQPAVCQKLQLLPLRLAAEVIDVVLDVFINLPGRLDKGLSRRGVLPAHAAWSLTCVYMEAML